jgi:hypothetical protein
MRHNIRTRSAKWASLRLVVAGEEQAEVQAAEAELQEEQEEVQEAEVQEEQAEVQHLVAGEESRRGARRAGRGVRCATTSARAALRLASLRAWPKQKAETWRMHSPQHPAPQRHKRPTKCKKKEGRGRARCTLSRYNPMPALSLQQGRGVQDARSLNTTSKLAARVALVLRLC